MAVLSGNDIRRLLEQKPPLVEGWIDLDEQVQANGFDITLRDVSLPQTAGKIMVANSQRVVSELSPLVFDGMGNLELVPGTYIINNSLLVRRLALALP